MDTAILLVVLASLGYAAFYAIGCAIFPFGRCRRPRCDNGRIYSRLSRKVFRYCRRCEGTGRRVRVGRRVYEHLRAEYRRGSK